MDEYNSRWISSNNHKITPGSIIVDFRKLLKLHSTGIYKLISNNFGTDMDTTVKFDRIMIAPCGMNCGTCIAYLRPKNKCCGCWPESGRKANSCARCIIKNCNILNNTTSKFCFECEKFPCQRLKQLDKRYRTRYKTSFIENLLTIKEIGIENYLVNETSRWTCPHCGSIISVHRDTCITCNRDLN